MQRGSEIIREETKKAEDLVDNSIKMWTDMGLPVFRARKKQRRDLEDAANILKNEGFTNDQIYTAMRQGRHGAVIKHVESLKNRELAVKPAEIITFAEDDAGYQSTGMTMDQVLNGVMGKLDTGMSLSDAISDTTGKDIGGIQAAIMKKRAGAVQSAFGIDPTELRSLAREDFIYGENIGGTINIVDPEAAAKAQTAMRGKGVTGASSRYGRFFKRFGNALGFNADYREIVNEDGSRSIVPVYPDDSADLAGQAMDLSTEANEIVAKIMAEGKASSIEEAERMAQQIILKRLQQGDDTLQDPQDPQDPPQDPPPAGTRTDMELSEEEVGKLDALTEQISGNLVPEMGIPRTEEDEQRMKQKLITLYTSFGFSLSDAQKMAEFQFSLILDQAASTIRKRRRLRSIPMLPDDPAA